jgi:hypothetical protein
LQDPPSEWDILRTTLSEKLHDPDGWRRLVEIAETSSDAEQIKATYALMTAAAATSSNKISPILV